MLPQAVDTRAYDLCLQPRADSQSGLVAWQSGHEDGFNCFYSEIESAPPVKSSYNNNVIRTSLSNVGTTMKSRVLNLLANGTAGR